MPKAVMRLSVAIREMQLLQTLSGVHATFHAFLLTCLPPPVVWDSTLSQAEAGCKIT